MDALSRWANVVPANFRGVLSSAKPNVALTFDDAFSNLGTNAIPIMHRHGFPSTIFVPVGAMGKRPEWSNDGPPFFDSERIMTAVEVAAFPPDLVTFGSHSVSHEKLTELPDAEVLKQALELRRILETLLGREIDMISVPYGEINDTVAKLCEIAGYRFIYTIQPVGVDCTSSERFRGRFPADPSDGALEFFLKAHGAYAWLNYARKVVGKLGRIVKRLDLRCCAMNLALFERSWVGLTGCSFREPVGVVVFCWNSTNGYVAVSNLALRNSHLGRLA